MSPPKFLLDENVSHKTLRRLRRCGFPVESVRTLGLSGMRNNDLLDFTIAQEYMLITHDRDFLFPRTSHHGIIIVMIHPKTDEHAGSILERFIQTIDPKKIIGKLVKLEEKYWSIH